MALRYELFSYIDERARVGHTEFGRTYLRELGKVADWYDGMEALRQLFHDPLMGVGARMLVLAGSAVGMLQPHRRPHAGAALRYALSRPRRGGIVMHGGKFPELTARLAALTDVTVFDLVPCMASECRYMPAARWYRDLYRAYQMADAGRQEEALQRIAGEIARVLSALAPRAVVLWNDSQFFERALSHAARLVGVPVLTIQHGLLMASLPAAIIDGRHSDYLLVWGEYFREMCVANGVMPAERLRVLGYPYPLPPVAGAVGRPQSVCFLGQPWEALHARYLAPRTEMLRQVWEACEELGVPLYYRPHPAERSQGLPDGLPPMTVTPAEESLAEAIARYDVFLSINSTALIEAALQGKISVQLADPAFTADDFAQLGACYRIDAGGRNVVDFLAGLMAGRVGPMPVSADYIFRPTDAAERLLALVDELVAEDARGAASGRERVV